MTVTELIQELMTYDPDWVVVAGGAYRNIVAVEESKDNDDEPVVYLELEWAD